MASQIGLTLQKIGFANLLWNKVELLWYLYFTTLLQETSRGKTDAIYRALDTGNKKRTLILSVAIESLREDSTDYARLKQAVNHTNDMAKIRNALIHADFHLTMENSTINIGISRGGDHAKPNRLGFLELDSTLSEFIENLKSHIGEIEKLLPQQPPLPPGMSVPLTTARWINLLEEHIITPEERSASPASTPND